MKVHETSTIREHFYAIALDCRNNSGDTEAYFKADRYSPYSGRLQVEWDVECAQRFKTEKGARAAIARLLDKGTIKPYHNPRVVFYVESVTRRWETLVDGD